MTFQLNKDEFEPISDPSVSVMALLLSRDVTLPTLRRPPTPLRWRVLAAPLRAPSAFGQAWPAAVSVGTSGAMSKQHEPQKY